MFRKSSFVPMNLRLSPNSFIRYYALGFILKSLIPFGIELYVGGKCWSICILLQAIFSLSSTVCRRCYLSFSVYIYGFLAKFQVSVCVWIFLVFNLIPLINLSIFILYQVAFISISMYYSLKYEMVKPLSILLFLGIILVILGFLFDFLC